MVRRVLYFFATLLYRVLRDPSQKNLDFTAQVIACVHNLSTEQPVLLLATSRLLELWESRPQPLFAPMGLHAIFLLFQEQGWRYNLDQNALTHQADYFGVGMEQMVSAVFWLRGETKALQGEEETKMEEGSSSSSSFWRIAFESPQQAFTVLRESCHQREKSE